MKFSARVMDLREEGAYAVLARAQDLERQGRQIIHFEIGQPDFDTFAHIRRSAIASIEAGRTRYNPPAGIPELRAAIAADAGKRRGMEILPEQVVIGPGAKPGLFFPMLALVEPGDEVIYPDPGFPTYAAAIAVARGKPVPAPLSEPRGFSFDLEALESLVSERTRLLILNSPSNPTGNVLTLDDLERIAYLADRYDFWVMSDEIYARLVYGDQGAPSIAALPGMARRTILVDGFSKTYAMTGWRLGFTVMPAELAQRVSLLLTHSIGCTATFTQWAGLEAVLGPQEGADAVAAEYRQRRDRMIAGLNALPGVTCQMPMGAFYAFPNVKKLGLPSREVARRLLDEAGVAVLPGDDFGPGGEGYLRLCFATSVEVIDQGLERIRAWLSVRG